MTRIEIITELKRYFTIKELVCNHTFDKFGELSWQYLQTELLHSILVLRTQIIKEPMFINYSDKYQRGLRCNICQLVKDKTKENKIYLSAHVNGAGIDFHTQNHAADHCRNLIIQNSHILPYPIRLENAVSWVHIDVYDSGSGRQITMFNG